MEDAIELAKGAELAEMDAKGMEYDVELTQEVFREVDRLMGWYQQWQPKYPLEIVVSELEGEFMIPGVTVPYTFRIDRIEKDIRGQLWVTDRKTTKKTFPNLFRGFEMDYQLMGYVLGARSLGYDVKGAIVKAMRKLKRVKHPNELFMDEKFQYSNAQLDEFLLNRLQLHNNITEKLRVKESWRKNPDQCFSIRGECPYYKLCRYPETEEQTLAAYYVKEEQVEHPGDGEEEDTKE